MNWTNDLIEGTTTTRLSSVDADTQIREARAHKARHNLAAMALERPDPAEWLADILDALGLRGTPRKANPPRSVGRGTTTKGHKR